MSTDTERFGQHSADGRARVTDARRAFNDCFLDTGERHRRGQLLAAISQQLQDVQSQLIDTAVAETHLSRDRLEQEFQRTTRQLAMFSESVDVLTGQRVVDPAGEGRPTQVLVHVPIGPVANYCAGNFPFAFGVAGGDTASALAAGCPVVVKPHPGYPATSHLTMAAIRRSLPTTGYPESWVSLVEAGDDTASVDLVRAPGLAGVTFTGSKAAGRLLFDAASSRPDPIPFFGELGSLNPVIVTAGAAQTRSDSIVEQLSAAILGSAGQLCTKPGLVLLPDSASGRAMGSSIAQRIDTADPMLMLSEHIATGFDRSLGRFQRSARVQRDPAEPVLRRGVAIVIDTEEILERAVALDEIFGPATFLCHYRSAAEAAAILATLEGTLAAAIYIDPEELDSHRSAIRGAVRVSGRVVFNQVTTGLPVGPATVHGGPWPATTSPLSTSVGTQAIQRFLRPVGFQGGLSLQFAETAWPGA